MHPTTPIPIKGAAINCVLGQLLRHCASQRQHCTWRQTRHNARRCTETKRVDTRRAAALAVFTLLSVLPAPCTAAAEITPAHHAVMETCSG